MASYATLFTVEGVGEFPFDMLRYDTCYPLTSEDVHTMLTPLHEKPRRRKVRMSTRSDNKYAADNAVTEARWESFLWRVSEVEVRKL